MSQGITKAGVIGWPVDHSLSPRLFSYWLKKYKVDGLYKAYAVNKTAVSKFLNSMHEKGLTGLNVTVPYKQTVMGHVDLLSDRARKIGAVNTITLEKNGLLYGDNTDGFGFIENLKQNYKGLNAFTGACIVIGAGGAARAIVTATTLGMKGKPPLELTLDELPKKALVNDIVYSPLHTKLLINSRARGNPTVDGIGMLLHQARPGFASWFGANPTVTEALRNHVLIENEG